MIKMSTTRMTMRWRRASRIGMLRRPFVFIIFVAAAVDQSTVIIVFGQSIILIESAEWLNGGREMTRHRVRRLRAAMQLQY